MVLKIFDNVRGSCVKPYNSIVKWLASALVPCYGRLTLVCDAYGFDIRGAVLIDKLRAVSFNHFIVTLLDSPVNLHWVMLTPARVQ